MPSRALARKCAAIIISNAEAAERERHRAAERMRDAAPNLCRALEECRLWFLHFTPENATAEEYDQRASELHQFVGSVLAKAHNPD